MKNFFRKISTIVATGFGIGCLLPIGQGTLATLLVLPVIKLFLRLTSVQQLGLLISMTIAGIYLSSIAEKRLGTKDDHRIVIDEIVSVFITFAWLPVSISWWAVLAGILLNRVFDWWKPFPADRFQRLPSGIGIMADDLIAGLYSAFFLRTFLFFLN